MYKGRVGGGWGGKWGYDGGWLVNPPVDTFGLAIGPDKHPHRSQRPLEGVTDVFTQLQKTTALLLLVLPIDPKAHIMNTHGLTGPGSHVKKQTWLRTYVSFISLF